MSILIRVIYTRFELSILKTSLILKLLFENIVFKK